MILIKGHNDYAKCEQLFTSLNESALNCIDFLEAMGFIVAIHNLPSHIDTPEVYAAVLLDQFAEMYLPETTNLN